MTKYTSERARAGVDKRLLHVCPDCGITKTRRRLRCGKCQEAYDAETLEIIPSPEQIDSLLLDF
ncbi:MAG: hypothetical protein NVS9B15_04790 [Acidobacteriaceae bacterium]